MIPFRSEMISEKVREKIYQFTLDFESIPKKVLRKYVNKRVRNTKNLYLLG